MIKDIKIGDKILGLDKKVFISAEVGTTCNGDVETAKKLIDAAKEAGMDAVKFQMWNLEEKFSDKNINYIFTRHDGEVVTENIYQMLKQYEMSFDEYQEISDYAKEKDIIMFFTPLFMEAIDMMEKLNMPAYKIATWDVTFNPFIKKIAKLHKPTIIDLGASGVEEVARILEIFNQENNDKIILLHCYHTKNYDEMNIRTIEYLRETFGCLSGFSAPDANNDIDYLSLAYKPVYIEKRLTLYKKDPRHHHGQALEPEEMKLYVKRIHELSNARGKHALIPTQADKEDRKKYFNAIVANKDIKQGEEFTFENLTCKRPLMGRLDPKYLDIIIGRVAKSNIEKNEPITWSKI